jgi:hypothetical protein
MFAHVLYYYKIYLKSIVDVNKASRKNQKTPVVWHALFRTYSDKIIAGGLFKLIHDLFQLSSPLILK